MKTAKLLVLTAFALSACGGGAPIATKKDAATVIQRLESVGAGSTSGMSSLYNTQLHGASGSATASVDFSSSVTSGGLDMSYAVTVTLETFSPDGKNTYDGNETVNYEIETTATGQASSASVVVGVKADAVASGEYAGHVTSDVTVDVDAASVAAKSGSVHLVLNGTISTDTQVFTFDNEAVDVNAQ